MQRRSKLMGLDIHPAHGNGVAYAGGDGYDEDGRPLIKVQIVGDPEVVRREWLLKKRIVALGGDPNIDGEAESPTPATARSVN